MPDSFSADYQKINELVDAALGDDPTRSQDELDKLSKWDDARVDAWGLASKYYDGDHDTLLTDRQKQYLEKHNMLKYAENFCETVVDALVERLRVVGVTTSLDYSDDKKPAVAAGPPGPPGGSPLPSPSPQEPGTPPSTGPVSPLPPKSEKPEKPKFDLGAWIWERVWDGSQGDEKQIDILTESVKLGDSFIIVDFDTVRNRPRLVRNGPDICKIVYENGEKQYAIKKWYTKDKGLVNPDGKRVCRLNIYTDATIEKWYRLHDGKESVGGWVRWLDEGDPTWPLPWVDANKQPMGIPVFHFANRRRGDSYGVSEIWGVIPQQDRLNKELLDLSSILDQMGYPQRWSTGLDNTDKLKSTPGEVWNAANENAEFGQFDAAPIDGPLKAIESTIIRIATRSHTPAHLLYLSGGEMPSGEALKTAEAGLVAKAETRHIYFGNQYGETFRMAAKVAYVYAGSGDQAKPPCSLEDLMTCSIEVKWKDPNTRNEKEHLETLQLMSALGIPEEEIWSRIPGIDVDAMKLLKQQSEYESAIRTLRIFNAGGPVGNPGEMEAANMPSPSPFGGVPTGSA